MAMSSAVTVSHPNTSISQPGSVIPAALFQSILLTTAAGSPGTSIPAEGCRSYPMRCRGVRFAREDFALAEPKSPTVESSLTTERNADAETPQVMLMRRIGVACEVGTSSAMSGRRSAGCLLTGNCSTVTR